MMSWYRYLHDISIQFRNVFRHVANTPEVFHFHQLRFQGVNLEMKPLHLEILSAFPVLIASLVSVLHLQSCLASSQNVPWKHSFLPVVESTVWCRKMSWVVVTRATNVTASLHPCHQLGEAILSSGALVVLNLLNMNRSSLQPWQPNSSSPPLTKLQDHSAITWPFWKSLTSEDKL